MNESDQWRVEALLNFYEQQMLQFRHTQDIEWKANFGIWTLLALGIYTLLKHSVLIIQNVCIRAIISVTVGIILIALAIVHCRWLGKIHYSEACDKELWTRYRSEALALIRGNQTLHDHEQVLGANQPHGTDWWRILEVTVTAILCASVFALLLLAGGPG